MTTMTQRLPFADTRHHPATTIALAFLFWLAAAVLVATAHIEIDSRSASGGVVAAIGAVLASAYCYTRFCSRCGGISHALGVGTAWLALAIAAEIAMTARLGHGWYALLGSPARPLMRNVFLFVWAFAPALFAQGDGLGREEEA